MIKTNKISKKKAHAMKKTMFDLPRRQNMIVVDDFDERSEFRLLGELLFVHPLRDLSRIHIHADQQGVPVRSIGRAFVVILKR